MLQRGAAIMSYQAFPPLRGDNPRIIILGTFPSPLSREKGEYYGNPRNQFWRLIFGAFDVPFATPDYAAKKAVLFENRIALCDVITECEHIGALDTGIRNPKFWVELPEYIAGMGISKVFFNGNNAYKFYQRGIGKIERRVLPSSSPANAGTRLDEKMGLWREGLRADEPPQK
jgi:hypoxanthine-DNA glycosylase